MLRVETVQWQGIARAAHVRNGNMPSDLSLKTSVVCTRETEKMPTVQEYFVVQL